jgi:FkbM family methyltransferase
MLRPMSFLRLRISSQLIIDKHSYPKKCHTIASETEYLKGLVMTDICETVLGFKFCGLNINPSIFGAWKKNIIPEYEEICLAASVWDDLDVLIDVGANTGLYCVAFAGRKKFADRKDSFVYAFEPQFNDANYLRNTIHANGWTQNFKVSTLGLSNKSASAWLYNCGDNSTGSSLCQTAESQPIEKIELTTIDLFCEIANVNSVDFLKIDVEGHEYEVLQGAKQSIKNFQPIVFIEFAPTTDSVHNSIEFLLHSGYKIFHLNKGKILRCSDATAADRVKMFLCLSPRFYHLITKIENRSIRHFYFQPFMQSNLNVFKKYSRFYIYYLRHSLSRLYRALS